MTTAHELITRFVERTGVTGNSAYERYGPANEARAFRIAWTAVKRNYVQRAAGIWVRRPARA